MTTQLNSSPIEVRNQRKFALNLSPIRIRISTFTPISIWGITFRSDVQSRLFKLGWNVLQFYSLPKVQILTLNGLKTSIK